MPEPSVSLIADSSPLPALNDSIATGRLLDAIIRRGDSPHTRRAYAGDLQVFARWLADADLRWVEVSSDDLDRYRESLAEAYARTTVNRRLTVVRTLYAEAHRRGLVATNPGDRLRGVRGRDERDGGALTRAEARQLMATLERDLSIPAKRLLATRDRALLGLLLRTGLRRFELVALRVGDLGESQGHHVLTVQAGKGNVARTVKVPPDLWRMIIEWLDAAQDGGLELAGADPLFVEVRKGGRLPGAEPLSDRAVHHVVTRRLRAAGLAAIGPHGLRASFVTLALEGGAPLHLVQRAAGHADPRTTERYWRRKDNLDDNAVDYIRL